MAVGVHGSFVVKGRSRGNAAPAARVPDLPLAVPTTHTQAAVEALQSELVLDIMKPMGSAEIYTMLLAALLVGGALWVISRFTHRD